MLACVAMVFGLFSKEKALQRTIERATNKLAQQADRWAAMEQLQKDGSEDALYGLCKRFGVTSMKQVEDEQEKNWVVDVLVGFGATALPAITRYVKSGPQLSFALKAVERIGTPAQILEVVDRILADEEPGYTRDPERRLDVIRWLGELDKITPADRVSRIAPYLKDFDQNVRCAAAAITFFVLDATGKHGDGTGVALSPRLERGGAGMSAGWRF